ncbi:hypothetical protein MRX96_032575 [Rhipicephalus microplus]
MAKKQVEANHGLPKAGRSKRQVAASDNAAGSFNEAAAAKRPRGRPSKGVSVEPLATKSIATTADRRLWKVVVAMQLVSANIPTSNAVMTDASRASCRKRSRGPSPSSASDAASEAPKRRNTSRKVSRGRSSLVRKKRRIRVRHHARYGSSALEHALEVRQEASPQLLSHVVEARRKAGEGEEGSEQRLFNYTRQVLEGTQDPEALGENVEDTCKHD